MIVDDGSVVCLFMYDREGILAVWHSVPGACARPQNSPNECEDTSPPTVELFSPPRAKAPVPFLMRFLDARRGRRPKVGVTFQDRADSSGATAKPLWRPTTCRERLPVELAVIAEALCAADWRMRNA